MRVLIVPSVPMLFLFHISCIPHSSGYHFGYETENGIRAEEQGSPSDAQGGFSYKGDDGHTYTITYTSGEGGFRPQVRTFIDDITMEV